MTTDHPVEMDHVIATPVRDDPDKYRLGSGHKSFPTDLPVYMSVTRHMGDVNGANGLLGHTLDIDAFAFHANVSLKLVRGRAMVILLDGKEIARVPAPTVAEPLAPDANEQ